MRIGAVIVMNDEMEQSFEKLSSMGIHSCQLHNWNPQWMTEEMAERIREYARKYKMEITAFWCGWSGPIVWDFKSGPHTLGLVPVVHRRQRCEELKAGSDFAKKLGVTDLITHVGFLPENPATTEYASLVADLRDLAQYVKGNGQYFLFETGQETPVTLKRTIEDIDTGNLGVNLDPANLILYGKGNPIDALDVLGKYVRGIHGKDGFYPTDGYHLGEEVRIGDGKVNYPLFVRKLAELGYQGAVTIEREITGDKQTEDIIYAKSYLEKLFKDCFCDEE